MKCNAHLNNTFYSYFRVHGRNQPRVFFHVRNGGVDAKRGFLQHGMLSGVVCEVEMCENEFPRTARARTRLSFRFVVVVVSCHFPFPLVQQN